jgi:hypothetical protein
VVVLSRGGASEARVVRWDGATLDDAWARELDGADVVLNLATHTITAVDAPREAAPQTAIGGV